MGALRIDLKEAAKDNDNLIRLLNVAVLIH